MIDYFSIALTHGLIALAAFRLMFRDDLDWEEEPRATGRKLRAQKASAASKNMPGDA